MRQALAADTAQQLKEIGIDTSIRGTGWDTAYDEAQSQPLLWAGARTRRWNFIIFTIQRQIRGWQNIRRMRMRLWALIWMSLGSTGSGKFV